MQLNEHIKEWRKKRERYRRHIKNLERVIRGQRYEIRKLTENLEKKYVTRRLHDHEVARLHKHIDEINERLNREEMRGRLIDNPAKRQAIIEIGTLLATHGYHDAADDLRTWYKGCT